MPYIDINKRKNYHKEYMRKYNATHKLTPEQKLKKSIYSKSYRQRAKLSLAEYQHKRYIRDKEKIQRIKKIYREANKEKIKAHKHAYYLKNFESFSRKAKEYYHQNKDKIRSYKREYAKSEKGRYFSYQVSAKKRGIPFNLEETVFYQILNGECHYCGKLKAYGIDRKDSNIGYELKNCLPCCKICNYMKNAHSYDDFINHIIKITTNLNLNK